MTSEIDKEDPYSLLTQYEIDLRRAIHDYYSFIDCDDPFASSKGLMTGSGNLYLFIFIILIEVNIRIIY